MSRFLSTQRIETQALVKGGLRYDWRPSAFLTRPEVEYALAQLWRLCAGTADWQAGPLLEIPAINLSSVQAMYEMAPKQLNCIPLSDILPPGDRLELDTDRLPALCQVSPSRPCEFRADGSFPLDLVAATFLMLTRWEEIYHPGPLDRHGRPQAEDTLAYRQGFLHRPVIDEWALVLRSWLERLAPGWRAETPQFRVLMTHDLDRLKRFSTPWRIIRSAAAELLLRSHSPSAMLRMIGEGVRSLIKTEHDPYYQAVSRQMEICESLGLRGVFNVLTARKGKYDEGYDLDRAPYRSLFEEIQERGHEIGWHPGYRAAENTALFSDEKARMDKIMGATRYGGRCHYLRWTPGKSWEQWDDHGLLYDSSLSYARHVGFRCGTSHPFPCFSITRRRELSLVEEPLVIMDCALKETADRQGKPARLIVEELLSRAKAVGGSPSVLYHNTYSFSGCQEKRTVEELLDALAEIITGKSSPGRLGEFFKNRRVES